jgi:hypothetical protein
VFFESKNPALNEEKELLQKATETSKKTRIRPELNSLAVKLETRTTIEPNTESLSLHHKNSLEKTK